MGDSSDSGATLNAKHFCRTLRTGKLTGGAPLADSVPEEHCAGQIRVAEIMTSTENSIAGKPHFENESDFRLDTPTFIVGPIFRPQGELRTSTIRGNKWLSRTKSPSSTDYLFCPFCLSSPRSCQAEQAMTLREYRKKDKKKRPNQISPCWSGLIFLPEEE
jgi:hypothetical protein